MKTTAITESDMKYLVIDLYSGRSREVTEQEFLKRKKGNGRAIKGTGGVTAWRGEEELLIMTETEVDMKQYILVQLYDGKSQTLTEDEAAEWITEDDVPNVAGSNITWLFEEHLLIEVDKA